MLLPQTFCALLIAAVGIPAYLAGPTNEPRYHVELPELIRQDDIKLGDNIYLECKGPGDHEKGKYVWERNGVQLEQDTLRGIVIVTNKLVLLHVTSNSSGEYRCREVHWDSMSAPYNLKIQYKPVGKRIDTTVFTNLEEEVELKCEFEGNPSPDICWSYETASGDKALADSRNITEKLNGERRTSVLRFRPTSLEDYNTTFVCKGFNALGMDSVRFTLKPLELQGLSCSLNEYKRLNCSFPSEMELHKYIIYYQVVLETDNDGKVTFAPSISPSWDLSRMSGDLEEVVVYASDGDRTINKTYTFEKYTAYKLN